MKFKVTASITATFEVDDTDYDEDNFPYPNNIIKSIERIEEDSISEDPSLVYDNDTADVTVKVEKIND